jgi:hypothetical protein
VIKGQAGAQFFFSDAGRAFCLYVVLGSYARRGALVPKVNAVLAGVRIDSLVPATPPTVTPAPPTSTTTTQPATPPPTGPPPTSTSAPPPPTTTTR